MNLQVNLVDWFKGKVSSRCGGEVVDPLIEVQPTPRALKRVLLVCLRCIDLDALKRPKMGQVVHMLEADEFPFRTVNLLEPQKKKRALPLDSNICFVRKHLCYFGYTFFFNFLFLTSSSLDILHI